MSPCKSLKINEKTVLYLKLTTVSIRSESGFSEKKKDTRSGNGWKKKREVFIAN
jgi:hypothetical protein